MHNNNLSSSGSYHSQFSNQSTLHSQYSSPAKKPVKRRGKYATLKYQIFLDASNLTREPLWHDKLEEASRGKFPSSMYYVNDQLQYRTKTITRSIDIPTHDAALCAEMFIQFLKDHTTLKIGDNSDIDPFSTEGRTGRIDFNKYVASLILPYVERCALQYGFDDALQKNMHDTIQFGVRIGAFNMSNITLERMSHYDGDKDVIVGIEGLFLIDGRFRIHPGRIQDAMSANEKRKKSAKKKEKIEETTHPMYRSHVTNKKLSKWQDMCKEISHQQKLSAEYDKSVGDQEITL